MAYPRFRRARTHKIIRRATGTNISLNSTAIAELAAATNGPGSGGFDISLPASVGDTLEWSFNGLLQNDGAATSFDIYTMNGSTRVNPFGSGLSASIGSTEGPMAWDTLNNVQQKLVGSALYTVQAGDIFSGQVTCRPFYVQSAATTKTLFSNANQGLQMWLKNLGPVAV